MAARRKSSLKHVSAREIADASSDNRHSDSRQEQPARAASPEEPTSETVVADNRVGSLHRRLADLQAQLAEAHKSLARQHQEREEDAESFARMMARLAQTERTLSQTKSKSVDLEARAEKNAAELAKVTTRVAELEAGLAARESQLRSEAAGEQERLQAQHAAELERLRAEADAERSRLKAEIEAEFERAATAKQAERDGKSERQAAEFATRLDAVNATLQEREAALAAAEQSAMLLENSLAEVRAELERTRETARELSGRLEGVEKELAEARIELPAARARQNDAEAREQKTAEALESMRDQLDVRSGQVGQLREKLALARERERELTTACETLKTDLAASEKTRLALSQAVAAMEALALDIKRIGSEARGFQSNKANANEVSGTTSEPPTQALPETPFQTRLSDAPEILIDGVTLSDERKSSESSMPTLRPESRQ